MDQFLDGIFQHVGGDTLLAIAAGLAVAFAVKAIPRLVAGVPFVDPRDLKRRLDSGEDVVVIDVREPHEFNDALGHIPGALNLPTSRLAARVKELRADLDAYADTPVYLRASRPAVRRRRHGRLRGQGCARSMCCPAAW